MNATEKQYVEKLKELVEHVGGTDPKWCHTCKEMLDEISALEQQIEEGEEKPKKETKVKICAGCGGFAHGNPGHDIT